MMLYPWNCHDTQIFNFFPELLIVDTLLHFSQYSTVVNCCVLTYRDAASVNALACQKAKNTIVVTCAIPRSFNVWATWWHLQETTSPSTGNSFAWNSLAVAFLTPAMKVQVYVAAALIPGLASAFVPSVRPVVVSGGL